ncbi:MAG: hypothetical protein JHC41_02355 [Nitrosopumilus sp.]|nr:hypothetical protein [Nitrosopumilus sp.]
MISNTQLFTIGNFDFRLHHLLIIGILVLSFSISFLIRTQSLHYGFELNEFDPFFNFRATEFLVNHGLAEYFTWHDDMSWHPNGRDISATSQVMLHITAAATYQIFGGNSSLYDFTIMFPVIFGSLTVVVIFALVRVMGGTTAGLFAALLYSVSVPIILRGTIGWFKSEPLGLFYGLLGLYFFLSGIKSENKKVALSKIIGGGIVLGFGLASWGGIQYFIIPIGIFILALPFIKKDHGFLIWSIPVFVTSLLLTTIMFERPGIGFVAGLGGLSLIVPTGFLVACIFIQKISKIENQIRNGLVFLFGIIIIGSLLIIVNQESNFLPMPSFRYLNAINPFLTTTIPLVDSVAEHATTTISESFFFHSILMIFSGLGIWLILGKKSPLNISIIKDDMIAFALIIGLAGIYVSSAFVRLELFASISIIILASIGLSILTREILSGKTIVNKKINFTENKFNMQTLSKVFCFVGIGVLLLIPLIYPVNGTWVNVLDLPPTILNGGTTFPIATNDWKESLEWIKTNTPKDSVVAAWWDYGYWITTLSERTTLADNATIDSTRIENIAKTFLSSPEEAWQMLQEMDADYVLVFVSGQRLTIDNEDQALYVLEGGGDESKKQWFMRIAGVDASKYLYSDGISGTDYFWNDTLLGKMFPFTTLVYVNLQTNEQSATYHPGFTPIYVKDIKYPSDSNGPLRLVHTSPSFNIEKGQPMIGVFVYEVNHNYVPSLSVPVENQGP